LIFAIDADKVLARAHMQQIQRPVAQHLLPGEGGAEGFTLIAVSSFCVQRSAGIMMGYLLLI
jgi:hypothetical protein